MLKQKRCQPTRSSNFLHLLRRAGELPIHYLSWGCGKRNVYHICNEMNSRLTMLEKCLHVITSFMLWHHWSYVWPLQDLFNDSAHLPLALLGGRQWIGYLFRLSRDTGPIKTCSFPTFCPSTMPRTWGREKVNCYFHTSYQAICSSERSTISVHVSFW